MCGICGFNLEDKPLLKRMCDLIIHRGPDKEGFFTNSEVSIGMRRLSIIDLKTGDQPQHNENEDIWIVFNGEIYNFSELRIDLEKRGHSFYTESDTEVIIHAYEEWGEKCLQRLRGPFAFCIYDSRQNILFLARDRMGLKPLYYYFNGSIFIFGSEIKSIICHDIKRRIDKEALNLHLSLRYTPFKKTLFKKIYKLPSASYLKFDLRTKNLEVKEYWKITYKINNNIIIHNLAKELKDLLEESVKIRLISEVPLGAFLSGGIDSSAVVAIMSKFIDEPVKTFSIGFEEGAMIDETKYSRFVSEYYNTDHTEIVLGSQFINELFKLTWHFDDLITDGAMIPVNLMAKYAKEKMTVALTGDGADEIFAGYTYYGPQRFDHFNLLTRKSLDFVMNFYNLIPSFRVRRVLSYFNQTKNPEDVSFRGILIVPDEEKKKMLFFKNDDVKNLIKSKFIKGLDNINQFINWDLKYQLPNLYNMKIDKATMASSLEARIPFLDHKIVEWASSIPSSLKLRGKTEKYILRLALKDILPPEILKRKKCGFGTPINTWIKKGFKEVSGELLERLEKREYLIKSDYVKKVRKRRNDLLFESRALNLIMIELWYETFIENDGLKPLKF